VIEKIRQTAAARAAVQAVFARWLIPATRGNYLPSHNALNGNGSGELDKSG